MIDRAAELLSVPEEELLILFGPETSVSIESCQPECLLTCRTLWFLGDASC